MPKEKSIPKRLSGPEALDSLIHAIYTRMMGHGHFQSHKAYLGYSASVKIEFRPVMSYAPPLEDDFTLDALPEGMDADGETLSESIEIPVRSPNQVREEADLALPVRVEEGGQLVEKMIPPARYKKQGSKKHLPVLTNAPFPTAKMPMADELRQQYGVQEKV